MGRPYKLKLTDTVLDTLRGLGQIQATDEEVSSVLHVDKMTLYSFFRRHPKARVALYEGRDHGKVSLRRAQLQAALKGDRTMLVWLGKQLLKQKDRIETDATLQHTISSDLAAILKGVDGTQRSLPTETDLLSMNSNANANGHDVIEDAEEIELQPDHPMKRFN